MADLFMSYANDDRQRAKALAEQLEQLGFDVWWDRDIPLGRPYNEIIPEEIQRARLRGIGLQLQGDYRAAIAAFKKGLALIWLRWSRGRTTSSAHRAGGSRRQQPDRRGGGFICDDGRSS